MGREKRIYEYVKRILDVVLAAMLLILLAFPMFLIAVVIRCDSEGGALFSQVRLGRDLRPFVIFKFRTMHPSAPSDCPSGALMGRARERSLTRVGKFLRRMSLDELPQLWNVLRGDMSLVGPRPVIPREALLHTLRARLGATAVRPGITGLAQTFGRDEADVWSKARLDALYAERISLSLDARVLVRTVGTVLYGTGCN